MLVFLAYDTSHTDFSITDDFLFMSKSCWLLLHSRIPHFQCTLARLSVATSVANLCTLFLPIPLPGLLCPFPIPMETEHLLSGSLLLGWLSGLVYSLSALLLI